jgi:hypothetical protein
VIYATATDTAQELATDARQATKKKATEKHRRPQTKRNEREAGDGRPVSN